MKEEVEEANKYRVKGNKNKQLDRLHSFSSPDEKPFVIDEVHK